MRICYVGKHGGQGNDDEGAIACALGLLGHDIVKIHEGDAFENGKIGAGCDFVLFHKWAGAGFRTKAPKVFWFFDKVCDENDGDPILARTMAWNQRWMARTMADPQLLVGFCTDGDWVAQDRTGKLVWLTQGFDERWAGRGRREGPAPEIAFFGTATRNGVRRRRCLGALKERYGDRLWVLNKETQAPIHGQALADLCISAKVVVAPDGPCTDRYWSNRVYLVTGLGGLLVHPRCAGLKDEYGCCLLTYESRDEMFEVINTCLDTSLIADKWRNAGSSVTMSRHTYRHRCEVLVEEVRRRL